MCYRIVICLLLFPCLLSAETLPQKDAFSLDALRRALGAVDDQRHSLSYDVSVKSERWDVPTSTWSPDGEDSLHVLLDGLAGSKIKIQYQPQVMKWDHGASPFYEIYKTFVYNGSYSVEAIEKQGPKDHAIPYLSATIYDGLAEKHIGPRSITGEEFAIGYARLAGSGSVTLLQMLSPGRIEGIRYKYLERSYEGKSGHRSQDLAEGGGW